MARMAGRESKQLTVKRMGVAGLCLPICQKSVHTYLKLSADLV